MFDQFKKIFFTRTNVPTTLDDSFYELLFSIILTKMFVVTLLYNQLASWQLNSSKLCCIPRRASIFGSLLITSSMARLGDLLDFSKHVATIILPKFPTLFFCFLYKSQSHTFLGNFCKGVKIFISLLNHFWATFIDI